MRHEHLTILLPDARLGGAQRVLLRLSREFAARGHSVDVVLLLNDGELKEEVPDSVRRVALLDGKPGASMIALKGLVRLRKYLAAERPACVLSSGTGTNVLLILASLFLVRRPRIVLREAASTRNRPSFFFRAITRLCFRRADACIGVSQGVAEELRAMGIARERVHSIPNHVDGEALLHLARTAPGLPDVAPPYLVTVGRLVRQKDHATLVRAFGRIADRIPHQLVIVGEGDCRGDLESLISTLHLQGRVILPGMVLNPQRLVRDAQVFVLSSAWEGYPNVLLEALAHGVRIVSTDCPYGPAEILEGGRYGALVPVADEEAMAAAILAALEGPSLAAGWLAAQPGPGEVASRYLEVIQNA